MSPRPVHRADAASPKPSAADLAAVLVELPAPGGKLRRIGNAAEALRNSSLTPAEREAILALVEAVRLLRERARLAGIDDAGRSVRLLLRNGDATERGPWATTGAIAVGSKNGLTNHAPGRARPDALLTVDAAVHELAHVVQFGKMSDSAKPHAAILEGIADTAAILATGDDTLGEEYFKVDKSGRRTGSIRELGQRRTSGPPIGPVVTRYEDAINPSTEEHAGGGVVSATFRALRAKVGRERSEDLLWAVIRDAQAWTSGGSWRELVLAMRRQAQLLWAGDRAALAALESALDATGLDAAVDSARAA